MERVKGYRLGIQKDESPDMIFSERREIPVSEQMRTVEDGDYFLRRFFKGPQDIYYLDNGRVYLETGYRADLNTSRRKAILV